MSAKQIQIKSKLFKLKEWLTVPETAQHLSNIFGEDVKRSDVLRLALDGHLKLSVNFVNHAKAKSGKVVPYEDVEWDEFPPDLVDTMPNIPDEAKGKQVLVMKSLQFNKDRYLNIDEKVITINGVWDLPMIGNEQLDIEHKYQQLTGGPEITLITLNGAFVEGKDGQFCQLQEYLKEGEKEEDYYPAGGLPHDSVLVVRTKALIDLQKRLSSEESEKEKPLGNRAETTYLNIIGALLEVVSGKSPGMSKHPDFISEAKLIEHFSNFNMPGLSKSNLELKFAEAKKIFSDN